MAIAIPTWEQVIIPSPLTVTPDTLVLDAIAQLDRTLTRSDEEDSPSLSKSACVLIVEGTKLLGIFTPRDVVRLVASGTRLSRKKIDRVMTQPVISLTLNETQNVLTALSIVRQHQISYLPVVDEAGQLVGLVTQDRLYQAIEPSAMLTLGQVEQSEGKKEKKCHHRATAFPQCQEIWQPIFENALDAIAITDDEGRYVEVNPAACTLFGVSREELLRSRVADFADPDVDVDRMWQQFLQHGEMSGEFRLYRRDGTIRETEFAAVANFMPHHHLSILRDTGDRKAAEAQLRDREAFLSSIYDGTAQAVFAIEVTATGEFYYLGFNRVAQQYAGLTNEQIQGKTPEEAFGLVLGEGFRQHYDRCLQAGTSICYEEQLVFEDRCIWTLTTLSPIRNEEGRIDRIVGTATDISDRKQAEADLKQSERKFRAIFDSTFEFMGLLTTEGIVVEANRTALDAIGADIADIIGQPFWATPWWTHSPQLQKQLQQATVRAAKGEFVRFEAEHLLANGTSVFVDFSLKPVFDEEGKVVMLIPEGRDITDRKRAEEALRESEQRWQFALEGSGDGVWDWNAQTNEVFYSRRWKEMLGFEEEEIGNELSEWDKRVHRADKTDVYAKLDLHLRGETDRYASEHRVLCKDGTYKWILDRGQVISRTKKGRPLRVIGVHTDISDRKLSEQKIREQAALIEIATDAISVRNLDNCVLFWSKGAERLYGWKASETLGKNIQELLYSQERSAAVEIATYDTLQKGYWQGELENVTKTGKTIIVASRWTLVRDESKKTKFILVVSTDITEKKQLEQQFYRTQRLDSLGTLAGGIAHDLNNIFAPILMISQLLPLKLKNLDARSQKLLKTLETSTKRGADLVKQILVFTRGTEGQPIVVQIGHLLNEVNRMARQTFPKSIEIRMEISTRTLWLVKADPTQLHQVLMNLVVNSRDAMPNGGQIELSAENREIDENFAAINLEAYAGKYIEISISDTGIGMASEILDRMFEPFFTTKDVGKGTGLGLSTVRGIVKNHGGFLQVSSQVGRGTQFKVYLPAVEETAL
ncbi:MAG: PAS domain S-box protein [Geitlerinemataceae cyanobacterium]